MIILVRSCIVLVMKPSEEKVLGKNKHAQALGRLGGLKGGKARAESLSPEERSAIARKAVKARWARVRARPK